ncbi:tribbles homolog 1-like [Anopheles cruzii]|uniref:tribbles homolog 1-like n=1 Tax=Anopheles cruzii TaxID=68878 RepID=UPI0022EC2B0E|nr:tribbles homolog 1-like [Anopheles cruzii]
MNIINSVVTGALSGPGAPADDLMVSRLHKPDEPVPDDGQTAPTEPPQPPAGAVGVTAAAAAATNADATPTMPPDLRSDPGSATAALNRLLTASAHLVFGGAAAGAAHKKCPYHRHCSRTHQQHPQFTAYAIHHHQRHHHHPYGGPQTARGAIRSGSGVPANNGTAAAAAAPSSPPGIHPQQRDAISSNVLPPPVNAAILAERYLLLDQVEGNNLYRCFDIRTHEELVCKIATNPCFNLLTAHFRLDGHPHVNALHKVIKDPNQTYLIFSASKGDLHSYVRTRKRLREPEARRLCRQMCEVVKSCHEQGIVLRDLKLRKFVFADHEGKHLKLESLEDAVVLNDPAEDLLQDKRGCPAYVSPEILRTNTTYSGKAADMWSLGVIMYTMLVGRYPFNDSEHASLFAKISRGQFTIPDCLSSKARCMIRALLRRDPEERITSDDVLHHPWLLHDDSKDLAYGSLAAAANRSTSGGGGGGGPGSGSHSSSTTHEDQRVPEWYHPSEDHPQQQQQGLISPRNDRTYCRKAGYGGGDQDLVGL